MAIRKGATFTLTGIRAAVRLDGPATRNVISQTDTSPDPTTILEQISMNARTISFQYTQQSPTGSPGGIVTFSWNCDTNKAQ